MDCNDNYNSKLSRFGADLSLSSLACELHKPSMQNFKGDHSVLMMNAFPTPFRFVATTLLSGILLSIGVLNLRDRISWTDPTDGIFWTESKGVLKAAEVDPSGAGGRAGIVSGDRLIAINKQATENLGQYYDSLYRLGSGAVVAYDVSGEAGARTVAIRLESKAFFTSKDGLRTLLAFLYLGIGLFVLIRGSRLPRTFHFYLICLASFTVWFYRWTPKLDALDWWVYCLSVLAFLLIPALFVHFCLRFPADSGKGNGRAWLLYTPALLLGTLQLLWVLGHLAPAGLPRTARSSEILDRIQLAYFAAGFFIGGAILLKRRLESPSLIVRQQMKWLLYGTLAGIAPFSLIYALPVLLGARANFAMDSSMLFLGFIPLSVGYALIHYRLMDVESIIRRSAAYFISSSLLLAVYLFFVIVLGRAFEWIAPQANFMVICLAVLAIALLFAPLRNAVQARLDRLFYKDQFENRSSLLEFARTLNSEISLAPLSRSILERISRTFGIDRIAMFLTDPAHPGFFRLSCALNLDALPDSQFYREDELVDCENSAGVKNAEWEADRLYRPHNSLMKAGLHYMQDLRFRGRRVGMIALGLLPQSRHFSTEDLDLLSALAGYAAIALENANLYRSVETKALELERLKAYTENIIESINVAVLALDLSGRITSCNRAFEELFHATREQVVGSHVEEILQEDVVASIQGVTGTKGWKLASPGNIFKLYLENRSGDRLIVNLSFIPILDPRRGQLGFADRVG